MSAGTASGLPGSGGPQGPSSRHGDSGGGGPASSSTPSGFNFEPASIFDWASSHHTSHHQNNPRGTNGSPYYQQAQQQQTSQPTHSLDLVNALGGGGGGGGGGPQQQQQSSLNPAATQQHNTNDDEDDEDEDDDDDDDDDDGSGNVSGRQGKGNGNGGAGGSLLGRKRIRGSGPTHRLNRKGGGRPKDFIWAYFDEHFTPSPTAENPSYVRHSAECKACGWTCEQPKAFRMRQHVVHSCENLPDAEKQRVQAIQTQKDAAAEQKKRSKRSDSRVIDGNMTGHSPLMANQGGVPAGGAGGGDNNNALNGSFGDMFSRLSGTHPNGGPGDASFFNYSTLSGNNNGGTAPDASTSTSQAGGASVLPGSAPTGGGSSLDKQGSHSYKNSTTSNSGKKRRKKEDSTSASGGIGSNWHLGSFLNPPGKMGKSPITCHVLDSSAGRPGANIKIRMDQLSQTGFMHVATGETDTDGRNNSLLSSTLKIDKNSIYKMTFYTREYFNSKGVDSFYPFVEVVFEVKEPDEHHHIALLLSPFSYTTYRGS